MPSSVLHSAIGSALLSLVKTPDSNGRGNDSYGNRARGYKALYEMLSETGVTTRRDIRPPDQSPAMNETLVFLRPSAQIVATEPTYLDRLREWIHHGGRIVVAPEQLPKLPRPPVPTQQNDPPVSFLEAIGVEGMRIHSDLRAESNIPIAGDLNTPRDVDAFIDDILDGLTVAPELQDVAVICEGTFVKLQNDVRSLSFPIQGMASLDCDEEPDGAIRWTTQDEESLVIAASCLHGDGEIIVVSDPVLFANLLIARADNSVLASRLLAPHGNAVCFDEFYHGLGVRGQPLYLLTRASYGCTTLGVLLVIVLWTWRKAVFPGPPLHDDEIRRRDIREYIRAMARFFSEGRRGRGQLVQELRDGVLRQLCSDSALPLETADVERIAKAVAGRNLRHAKRLSDTIRSIDDELQSRHRWSESQTLDAMRRISACL